MTTEAPAFDTVALEAMNAKAVQNQFFTPDLVYIDASLMKDYHIGAVYADLIKRGDQKAFVQAQRHILSILPDYQKRTYDTVDMFFKKIGYDDNRIDELFNDPSMADAIFALSPGTTFLNLIIRHTIRNQNNSRPANKYVKRKIDGDQYVMDAIPVTYTFNTWPLQISENLSRKVAIELGESLGVNVQFMCKDPHLFNQDDWNRWMGKIDCFYLNNLDAFTGSEIVYKLQSEMKLTGVYIFARKRFEKRVMSVMKSLDFNTEIGDLTARIDMMCDFTWLQNNDTRLTEEAEDVPMDDPSTKSEEQS